MKTQTTSGWKLKLGVKESPNIKKCKIYDCMVNGSKKVVWMGVWEILLNPFGSRGKYFKMHAPPPQIEMWSNKTLKIVPSVNVWFTHALKG